MNLAPVSTTLQSRFQSVSHPLHRVAPVTNAVTLSTSRLQSAVPVLTGSGLCRAMASSLCGSMLAADVYRQIVCVRPRVYTAHYREFPWAGPSCLPVLKTFQGDHAGLVGAIEPTSSAGRGASPVCSIQPPPRER